VAAAGGRVGLSLNQHGANTFQHTRQVLINIAVPKSEHFEIPASKILVSCLVFRAMRIIIVLAAIDLDNQVMLKTDEIDDEVMAWRLTAEMESF
jgi:hypothetical protein